MTLLPALIGTATPQVRIGPIAEGSLQRTIFLATRTAIRNAPAVQVVTAALITAARAAAQGRSDVTPSGVALR